MKGEAVETSEEEFNHRWTQMDTGFATYCGQTFVIRGVSSSAGVCMVSWVYPAVCPVVWKAGRSSSLPRAAGCASDVTRHDCRHTPTQKVSS